MEQERRYAVAIDGPSGAGKSSIARAAARELGFIYVDTGAIYRTVACGMKGREIAPEDAAAVEAALPETRVSIRYGDDGLQQMYLNGVDVTEDIRLPEISMLTSRLSTLPAVRAFLLDMQRDMADQHSVIMDGRDIGTVVLPNADVKIFLTASPEDRALRRFRELEKRGTPKDYEALLQEIRRRDDNDSSREVAPLRPAPGAVVLDTTGNTFEQSCRQILEIIRERIAL